MYVPLTLKYIFVMFVHIYSLLSGVVDHCLSYSRIRNVKWQSKKLSCSFYYFQFVNNEFLYYALFFLYVVSIPSNYLPVHFTCKCEEYANLVQIANGLHFLFFSYVARFGCIKKQLNTGLEAYISTLFLLIQIYAGYTYGSMKRKRCKNRLFISWNTTLDVFDLNICSRWFQCFTVLDFFEKFTYLREWYFEMGKWKELILTH